MHLMPQEDSRFSGLCQRDRHNAGRLRNWSLIWTFTFLLAILTLGPGEESPIRFSPWWNLIAVPPLVAAFFMIKAFLQFQREADELVRVILFKAAATGFGVFYVLGMVLYLCGQVFGNWEDAGAIIWVAGVITAQVSFSRQWKALDE